MRRATGQLITMMLVASGLVLIGAGPRAACAHDPFALTSDTAISLPCYSDLAALYHFEQLDRGRFPYLDQCSPQPQPCDEYPVLIMLTMWGAARSGGALFGAVGFLWANLSLMLVGLYGCIWALQRLGARTWLLAASPTLVLYASLNWDLLAVAAATLSLLLLLRRRNVASGAALGIGAAAKLYPALLLVPFALQRIRDSGRRTALLLIGAAATVWAAINITFIVAAPDNWLEVFRFNRERGFDFDSLWTGICQIHLCPSIYFVNLTIPIIASLFITAIWTFVTRRHPSVPPWMLGFPMIVIVLVTGKFWSPQYALWLLPWFALSRIPWQAWLGYQLAEVVEFFARTSHLSDPNGGITLGILSLIVVVRALLLLRCLWLWMLDPLPFQGVISTPTRTGMAE